MRRYRFGDPVMYKKNLLRNGVIFVLSWHFAAYSAYKWRVSKMSEADQAKFKTYTFTQQYCSLLKDPDQEVTVYKGKGLSFVSKEKTTYGDLVNHTEKVKTSELTKFE